MDAISFSLITHVGIVFDHFIPTRLASYLLGVRRPRHTVGKGDGDLSAFIRRLGKNDLFLILCHVYSHNVLVVVLQLEVQMWPEKNGMRVRQYALLKLPKETSRWQIIYEGERKCAKNQPGLSFLTLKNAIIYMC